MNAHEKNAKVQARLERAGIGASLSQAQTLRRAELTLQRWAEGECGSSNQWKSWNIGRDETTGKAYMYVYPHAQGQKEKRYAIPDRETGALKRVEKLCKELNIHFFHQTDPRGCALYVSREPITDRDYYRAVACCD